MSEQIEHLYSILLTLICLGQIMSFLILFRIVFVGSCDDDGSRDD